MPLRLHQFLYLRDARPELPHHLLQHGLHHPAIPLRLILKEMRGFLEPSHLIAAH